MADSTNDTSGPDGIWYFSIGPSTGDLRGGLLVAGEFTPPGPSPVMSQQPDHLPKLAPVVS